MASSGESARVVGGEDLWDVVRELIMTRPASEREAYRFRFLAAADRATRYLIATIGDLTPEQLERIREALQ